MYDHWRSQIWQLKTLLQLAHREKCRERVEYFIPFKGKCGYHMYMNNKQQRNKIYISCVRDSES